MGDRLWALKNRIRRWFNKPALPRPCCRNKDNLGSVEVASKDGKLTYRRCKVCQSRHFEMVADPGRFGLRGF